MYNLSYPPPEDNSEPSPSPHSSASLLPKRAGIRRVALEAAGTAVGAVHVDLAWLAVGIAWPPNQLSGRRSRRQPAPLQRGEVPPKQVFRSNTTTRIKHLIRSSRGCCRRATSAAKFLQRRPPIFSMTRGHASS
jgi:hypothetical protein